MFIIYYFEGKRDVTDYLMNQIGLQTVLDTLKTSGVNLTEQFQIVLTRQLTKLLFSSQDTILKSKAVLNKLLLDLHNHASNTFDIVNAAIEDLNKVLVENIQTQEGNLSNISNIFYRNYIFNDQFFTKSTKKSSPTASRTSSGIKRCKANK